MKIASLLLAAALLASCTGGSSRQAGPTSTATGAPSATASGASDAPVLATVVSNDPHYSGIRLDITALVRTTPTLWVLRARLSSADPPRTGTGLDGYGEGYRGGGFADIKLVDVIGAHAARVLQVKDGTCVCSPDSSLQAGHGPAERDVYAAFPALPGDPRTVIVAPFGFTSSAPIAVSDPQGRPVEGEPSSDPDGLGPARVFDLLLRSEALDDKQSTATTGNAVSRSISSDVLFAFGKADLTATAKATLTATAAELTGSATGAVVVVGHTDSVGSPSDNVALSLRRAQSVVSFLQPSVAGAGLTLSAQGKGESEPVADESGPEPAKAAARNRRVTITYQRKKPLPPSPAPSPAATETSGPLGAISGSTAGALTMRVDGLQRLQDTVVLGTFTLTNNGTAPVSVLLTFLDRIDSVYVHIGSFSGLFLVDRQGGQRYAVVTDSEKRCVCTLTSGGYPPLKPGESRSMFALFAAPPANVTTVDLTVPSFRNSFRALPVS